MFTNSADILAAAERAWGGLTSISDATPVILRVQVTAGNGGQLPPPVTPRGQGHLISITFSPDHFAVCDVARGYAFVSITDDAARDIEWTRYHFLEPLGWLMIDAMHAVAIHASSIALAGRAVLLCGDSGSGKTTLACACGRRGWTFLSGDATHLLRDQTGFEVRGRPGQIRLRASARELFPELAEASVAIRPNGKPDIETTPALLGLPVSQRAEANCIVFLDRTVFPDRNAATTPALHPYPKAAAAARLNNLICFGDEHIQREQRKTLEHFLSLPLFRLSYSEPASAELALRALIERGN